MSTDTAAPTSAGVKPQDAAAVRALVQRLVVAWREQDADKLALVYAPDVTLILPGGAAKGRDAVREYMAEAFRGKWKDTEVLGVPKELRYLDAGEQVVLLLSEGGAYPCGGAEVPAENAIRAMWLFAKRDGEWVVDSYANTPLGSPIPVPAAG